MVASGLRLVICCSLGSIVHSLALEAALEAALGWKFVKVIDSSQKFELML